MPKEGELEQNLRSVHQFLPKDFIESYDGLNFSVLGFGDEQGRVLSSLRYRRVGNRLHKLSTVQAHDLLGHLHPDWLYHSSRYDAVVHGVPAASIKLHLPASDYFRGLSCNENDPLPRAAGDFARLLAEETEAEFTCGVTGSLLVGAHHDQSDVDLVVYGREPFLDCRRAICHMMNRARVQSLAEREWRTVYERRGCELSFDEYLWHEQRKLNKLRFHGVRFDVTCVNAPHPLATLKGQKLEKTEFAAVITDDKAAFDAPAVYEVDHSIFSLVVAHTPTYTGQARVGERVRVAGWVEDCESLKRVIVGTSREAPGEFIKVIS